MSTFIDFLKTRGILTTTAKDFAGGTARHRVPFIFTSDKRIYESNSVIPVGIFDTEVVNIPSGSNSNATALPSLPESYGALRSKDRLSAMLRMAINPHTIRWQQGKRITKKDTIAGSTYQHFVNRDQQDNDIPILEFQGTTGNIQLTDSAANKETRAVEKLLMFHSLYNLTREPVLYWRVDPTNNLTGGSWVENHWHIIYETPLFPNGLKLTGFFNGVLDFTESAESPLKRDYSFSFTVEETSPSLDDVLSSMSTAALIKASLG